MKICSTCNIPKDRTEFYKSKASRDGYAYKCKLCVGQYIKDRREKYNIAELKRYYENRDKIREYQNSRYVPHYNRKPSTKESIAYSQKKWKSNNKHKVSEYAMRRRAAIRGRLPKDVDLDAIKAIYKEAAKRRKAGEDVHVDHIIPLMGKEMQGWHMAENLRIIPASENMSKGNRIIPELVEALSNNTKVIWN